MLEGFVTNLVCAMEGLEGISSSSKGTIAYYNLKGKVIFAINIFISYDHVIKL